MRAEVPKLGLDARIRSRTLRDVALEVLDIAREGLHRRGRRDQAGEDETHFSRHAVLDRRLRPHPGLRAAR